MNDEQRLALESAGVNLSALVERCMGSEELALRLLRKFEAEANLTALLSALDAGDKDAAFASSHALKGLSGNLAMTALHEALSTQVEHLRAGGLDEARALFPTVESLRNRLVEGLAEALGD